MAIFKIALAVRDLEMLTHPQKTVLLYLSTYTSATDGSRIYTSLDMLVRKTRLNERTVRFALAELQKEGWLIFESERKQRVKGYALVLEKLGLSKEDTKITSKPHQNVPSSPPVVERETYPPYEQGLPAQQAPTLPPVARVYTERQLQIMRVHEQWAQQEEK